MNHDFDITVQEGTGALNVLFAEYASEEYAAGYMQRRQWLRGEFQRYRTSSSERQSYLNGLMEIHTKYCHTTGSPESQRRHNAFVLKYITDRKYTPKEIAEMYRITPRAVWKDLNLVLDDLMILAFGIDGMSPMISKEKP